MSRQRFLVVVDVVLLAVLAIHTFLSFAPWTTNVGLNSDGAIPILMSNASQVTPYNLYYFGQDRFGGWPYLILQALHHSFGIYWTNVHIYAMQTAPLLLGAILLTIRNRAIGVACWAVVALIPSNARIIFDISQPLAGYLVLLAASWYCIVRLIRTPRLTWRLGTIAFAVLFLSSWFYSPLIIALPVLLLVEVALLSKEELSSAASKLRRFLIVGGLLLLATAAERIIHLVHQSYTLSIYGRSFSEAYTSIDYEFLVSNFLFAVSTWYAYPLWWTVLVALIGGALVLVVPRLRRLTGEERDARQYLRILFGGTIAGSLVLILIVLFPWVRQNGFNIRYFLPAFVLIPIAAAAGVLLLARPFLIALDRPRPAAWPFPLLLLAGLFLLPDRSVSPMYERLVQASSAVAAGPGRAALVGSYWGTYVFAGLAGNDNIVPVVVDGLDDRTPWTSQSLVTADRIWFSQYVDPFVVPVDETNAHLFVRDFVLRRMDAPALEISGVRFSPFELVGRDLGEVVMEPPMNEVDFCAIRDAVDLRFPPSQNVHIAISLSEPWRDCPLAVTPFLGGSYLDRSDVESFIAVSDRGFVLSASSKTNTFDGLSVVSVGRSPGSRQSFARKVFRFG